VYHLTLTENQTRVRVLLHQLRQARCDPRRWLRLSDVEETLVKTNDPESFRSLLLVTTQLEDIVENNQDIVYPVWSAIRMPYLITDGPGRKCSAAEMVSAPVWDRELNWMDVLGHLSKLIPAIREAATNKKPERIAAINEHMETELEPLLFEMSSVAPVLVGEVEALLGKERPQKETASKQSQTAKLDGQQKTSPTEVEPQTIVEDVVAKEKKSAADRTDRSTAKKSAKTAVVSKATDNTKNRSSKVAKTDRKKADRKKKSTPAVKPKSKVASGNSGRRALAVSIAETEAANDQYHQLSLPLFA